MPTTETDSPAQNFYLYENTDADTPWITQREAEHLAGTALAIYDVSIDIPSYGQAGQLHFRHQLIRAYQTGSGAGLGTGYASIDKIRIARRGNTPGSVVVSYPDSLIDFPISASPGLVVVELPQNWLYAQWEDSNGFTTWRWQLGYLEGGLPDPTTAAEGTFYNPGSLSTAGTQSGTVVATQSAVTQQFTRVQTVQATQSNRRQQFLAGTDRTTHASQSVMRQQFRSDGGTQ